MIARAHCKMQNTALFYILEVTEILCIRLSELKLTICSK